MMNQGRPKSHSKASGLLLIDKPTGISSFDVVARVRRAYGQRKVGHTGTLDPLATGLMGVLLGRATRLSPFLTVADKGYRASVALGFTTDTYDVEGQEIRRWPDDVVQALSAEEIENQLEQFRGQIQQTPPAHSAIKIDGERAYARARRGEIVEMPSRTVHIHELKLLSALEGRLDLLVGCSKGTYIRSLAHDLGAALGTGATLAGLRRTYVGDWNLEQAVPLSDIEGGDASFLMDALRPMSDVVSHFPLLALDDAQRQHVGHGRRFMMPSAGQGRYRVHSDAGELMAVVDIESDHTLRVVRGIPAAD